MVRCQIEAFFNVDIPDTKDTRILSCTTQRSLFKLSSFYFYAFPVGPAGIYSNDFVTHLDYDRCHMDRWTVIFGIPLIFFIYYQELICGYFGHDVL